LYTCWSHMNSIHHTSLTNPLSQNQMPTACQNLKRVGIKVGHSGILIICICVFGAHKSPRFP
jgi:hypothetical protein